MAPLLSLRLFVGQGVLHCPPLLALPRRPGGLHLHRHENDRGPPEDDGDPTEEGGKRKRESRPDGCVLFRLALSHGPLPLRGPERPPACETLLLHREDFKIPENLARFAVKAGMAGFVKKMAPAVRAFVKERRERRGVDPTAHDANAYGVSGAWGAVSKRLEKGGALLAPPPPPPEAATFFALGEGDGGGAAAAAPSSSFAARPASSPAAKAAAPPSLRGSVSFAQLPPSFSIARRASQEGGTEVAKRIPASFALSATASEESEEQQEPPPPRLRRAAASAPQLSSLAGMLASAAQDFADLLPARVGRAVGAALGSPLLGGSPPGTPTKGQGEGEGEEAAATAADPSSASVRSASPPPSSQHPHRPSHHHSHHSPSHSHHHHHVGRGGRRRGPAGGRARSPQAAPAAPTEDVAPAAAAPSHHHHHSRGDGGSLPLAADLLRAGVAVAVAVAVASRAGRAAGRAEARAEVAKLRGRHPEEEGEREEEAPQRRRSSHRA